MDVIYASAEICWIAASDMVKTGHVLFAMTVRL